MIPDFAALHPGYAGYELHAGYELNRFSERPVAEENKTLACPDKMRQPGIPT